MRNVTLMRQNYVTTTPKNNTYFWGPRFSHRAMCKMNLTLGLLFFLRTLRKKG